ncbi:MAG: sodium:proton antiporter [Thermoplasmata archaeon HGW-Thermoplasmata-1]|nr:MAG: sodium:proton antiporter [Thermoplasmata archaeon HGW-Thermoplasmata-1]
MTDYGFWALVPPLVAISLAMITRHVHVSLFVGVLLGGVIVCNGNPATGFLTAGTWMIESIGNPFNAGIVVFTVILGGIIGVMQKSGGIQGFGSWAARKAKTRRGGQLIAWLLGIVIFFDDYFNTLTVGTVMRPVTDELHISREKLAYITDSTSAPVCIISPISGWVGYIIGILGVALAAAGIETNAYAAFMRSIPYNFYAVIAVGWVLIIALSSVEYGPMKTAERRALEERKPIRDGAKPLVSKELSGMDAAKGARPHVLNLMLPIGVLITSAIFFLWLTGHEPGYGFKNALFSSDPSRALVYATLTTLIYCAFLYSVQRIMPLREFIEAMLSGFKAMVPALVILVLAWSIGAAVGELGLADFVVDAVAPLLSEAWIPLAVFLVSCFAAFATGTSWGTFAIMLPISVPLAHAFSPALVFPTIAATLGGAVFGDHCSPISDTTIISSMASHSDHIDHVKTQIPYALTCAAIACAAYVAVGYSGNAWAGWTVSAVLTLAVFLIARGRKRSRSGQKCAKTGITE